MKTSTELQTMALTYREICEGETPWVALGNFLNDFFGNFPDRREELIHTPIQELAEPPLEMQRWAIFCAASVEYLCQKYEMACPDWALASTAPLSEPWFHSPAAHKPQVRERLQRETPEPFTRRNIYCGNRVFLNKYEVAAERLQKLSA